MNLGRYEIETYYVQVSGQSEMRQRVIYIGNNGEDYFIERYYGTIREGYIGENTDFKNLSFTDIKTHIAGESIVIFDKSNPPKPQIYLSISTIESIQRITNLKLTIVDSQVDPVTLEFLTQFDADQAYSILNYLLQNPLTDINTMTSDVTPPVIFFNLNFFNSTISLSSAPSAVGPFSTQDGNQFSINIIQSSFSGSFPITKGDLVTGLVYDISDNRDGVLNLIESDILIYKDTINNSNLVTSISTSGNYIVKIDLGDLGQNVVDVTINIVVI